MPSHLVWGCHPNLQYESNWIRFLLQPLYESELFIFHSSECLSSIPCSDHIYLIESGLEIKPYSKRNIPGYSHIGDIMEMMTDFGDKIQILEVGQVFG